MVNMGEAIMTPIEEHEHEHELQSAARSSSSRHHRRSGSASTAIDLDQSANNNDHDDGHEYETSTAVNTPADPPISCKGDYMPMLGAVLDKEECVADKDAGSLDNKKDVDNDVGKHDEGDDDRLGDLEVRKPRRRRASTSASMRNRPILSTPTATATPTSSSTYISGSALSRLPTIKMQATSGMGMSGLTRISSTRHTEMESDLRRHISVHGKVRESEGVVEDKVMIDLGKGEEEVVLVDWIEGDPENPFNWSRTRKYLVLLAAVNITFTGIFNLVAVSVLTPWGTAYYGISRDVYLLSLSVPMITIAFAPMILAPLSEVFGRNMIYQISSIVYALLFIPQIWSKNYAGVLIARAIQGIANSVGNSMVGGTVADMFYAKERGRAMSVFSLVIFGAQGICIASSGWIGQYLGMKWAYGIQAIVAVYCIIINALVLRETRSDVLLSRRAKKLTQKTGIKHVCAADLQKTGFMTVMSVSLVRPFQYLATEPIVTALSAWIGFAWAIIFLGGSSVVLVFESYGFNIAQAASFEVTLTFGGILGILSQQHQEYLYARSARKHHGRAPPEARLYWAAFGGLMFPISLFIFAWTGRPGYVHWAVPAVVLCFQYWGVFCMYTGVFTYLADAYETYSSSAQAAQSLVRNLAAGLFPLFAHQMYTRLGYPYASTLVACLALLLSVAPILLIRHGKSLRKRSKVTSALCRDDDDDSGSSEKTRLGGGAGQDGG